MFREKMIKNMDEDNIGRKWIGIDNDIDKRRIEGMLEKIEGGWEIRGILK